MIDIVSTAIAVNIDARSHDTIGAGLLSLIQALLTRGVMLCIYKNFCPLLDLRAL